MFDEIIIRQDKNLRGRSEEEIIALLKEGIESVDKGKKVYHIKTEAEAITHAIKNAVPGSFITVCCDVVPAGVNLVKKLKEEEDHFELKREDIPNLKASE
jgi:cyanophycin synthetase